MTTFYPGVRPVDLIPGDSGVLRSLAGRCAAFADGFSHAATELRQIDSGSWRGRAAEAFRHALNQQPSHYADAASAFAQAAGALRSYAGTLDSAQHSASVAIRTYETAQHATAVWHSQQAAVRINHLTLLTGDPGASGRAQAASILEQGRALQREGERALRNALESASHAAPGRSSLAGRLLHYEQILMGAGRRAIAWEVLHPQVLRLENLSRLRLLRALGEAGLGRFIHAATGNWPKMFWRGTGRLGGLMSHGFLSKALSLTSSFESGAEAIYDSRRYGYFDGKTIEAEVNAAVVPGAWVVARYLPVAASKATPVAAAFSTGWEIEELADWGEKRLTGRSFSDRWADYANGSKLNSITSKADSLTVNDTMSPDEIATRNARLDELSKEAANEVQATKNPIHVVAEMFHF